MSRLQLVAYRDLRRVVEVVGFQWVRCRGSHNTFVHPDGRRIVLPDHGANVIVRPLLRKILRDVGLTPETSAQILGGASPREGG